MIPEIYALILTTIATTSLSVLVFRHNRTPCPSRPFFSPGNLDRSGHPPAPVLTELVVFSEPGYAGRTRKFQNNAADLTLSSSDFIIQSAIVLAGNWTLYDAANHQGNWISLTKHGGNDSNGTFKDHADWGGNAPFHVKSIRCKPSGKLF